MKAISTEILHYLTLLTTCITLITVVTRIASSVSKRMLTMQRRIESLRGAIQIIITQIDSLNSFLIKNHNLGDRTSLRELIQSFVDQYDKSDTEL